MERLLTGQRWYVIRTKPRCEERAQSYLNINGINTFLPWMETAITTTGKDVKPLFPSYLFARFDVTQKYPLVRWGKGIHSILGFGRYPTPVADEVISLINEKSNDNNVVRIAYQLNKNDRVRIRSGPLRDLLGIFDRWVSESGRVRILLNLIGYQPHVDLHYSQVEKIS